MAFAVILYLFAIIDYCPHTFMTIVMQRLFTFFNLSNIHDKSHECNAILVINVFWGDSIYSPSSTDITGLRIQTRNVRDFALFPVSSSYTDCPTNRFTDATKSGCSDFEVIRRQSTTHSVTCVIIYIFIL